MSVSEELAIKTLENASGRYICTLCDPMCEINRSDGDLLDIHIKTVHSEFKEISCVYCCQIIHFAAIVNHIDLHFKCESEQPFLCPVCPLSYNTSKALAQHGINSHDIKGDLFYKCGHCDEAMNSFTELKSHLSNSAVRLYHCLAPNCLVKSRNQDLIKKHSLEYHGLQTSLTMSTLSFMCSWPMHSRPKNVSQRVISAKKHIPKFPSCFFCPQCSFGTIHLEIFAQHLSVCRPYQPANAVASLSVTCTLYHCSLCSWTTTIRTMLIEHLQDIHPLVSEAEGLITEDFTIPISDEAITNESNNYPAANDTQNYELLNNNVSEMPQLRGFFPPNNGFLRAGLSLLCPRSLGEEVTRNSLSSVSNTRVSAAQDLSSMNCEVEQAEAEETHTNLESNSRNEIRDSTNESNTSGFDSNSMTNGLDLSTAKTQDHPTTHQKTEINGIVPEEYVQLYFNEPAFVAAYMKSGKFGSPNRAAQAAELAGVLEKLRQFASYRVPILGRANQRRVAGCPECFKPFNHGFTDLKKHLLITHLGVRRDISRFTIDFTHSGKGGSNSSVHHTNTDTHSLNRHSVLSARNGRLSSKPFRRKPSDPPFPERRSGPPKYESEDKPPPVPLATVSPDGLPTLVSTSNSYTGCAPVHRVIPGTGVSDHYEDLRSLDEVAMRAPVGRGGIVPLDEMGNPIDAAMMAANQPHSSGYSGATEIFLPKMGRQRVQLAYSYPVFKRLLEAYQVPTQEQIQLVNRMNLYARMYVIMDVLVPSGAQKRFSCPTCMYTSVHSLADIRKHIMGSHCGISTKRFRLCLRASRHDTTTYRLHSDDRMIRFVEDHRRRQIQLTDGQSNMNSASVDSDNDESKEELSRSAYQFNDGNDHCSPAFRPARSYNDQEELETETIEGAQYDGPPDETLGADEESDKRFLTAKPGLFLEVPSFSPSHLIDSAAALARDILSAHAEETANSNDEIHRRIELPFSMNVLRILLEREGMMDQFDDLVEKMHVYSKHHLTVVSRGNRIHAYICICGRRFAVVREELENDIRPASLADCRRHILGVHARIPQELLTLCCQASRISKESGYKLYADNSLLALAEQHKFRSSRMQTYGRKIEDEDSSPKRAAENISMNGNDTYNDAASIPSNSPNSSNSRSGVSFPSTNYTHSGPSQVAMRHVTAFSANHPLPPMLRAPGIKNEPSDPDDCPSPSDSLKLNGSLSVDWTIENPLKNSKNEDMSHYSHQNSDSTKALVKEERPTGLDLDVPRRVLTTEEAEMWLKKLELPNTWVLERIVRLLYSPAVFDQQVRAVLPDGDTFIASLHQRMRVYARHSVYITRLPNSPNPNQRVYVCCACLTTSHHGFGDVRKHILGVHAHVPERFKAAAMSSSRLNREDYSLYTEHQLMQLANTSFRATHLTPLTALNSSRSLRRRQRLNEYPPNSPTQNDSPTTKRLRSLDTNVHEAEIKQEPMEDKIFESPHNIPSNGYLSPKGDREHRPPIILTIPRPKAFHPSDRPDASEITPNLIDKSDDFTGPDLAGSSGSRSRRSMILKSKRPCPTST